MSWKVIKGHGLWILDFGLGFGTLDLDLGLTILFKSAELTIKSWIMFGNIFVSLI